METPTTEGPWPWWSCSDEDIGRPFAVGQGVQRCDDVNGQEQSDDQALESMSYALARDDRGCSGLRSATRFSGRYELCAGGVDG